jgi:hypothetical protein
MRVLQPVAFQNDPGCSYNPGEWMRAGYSAEVLVDQRPDPRQAPRVYRDNPASELSSFATALLTSLRRMLKWNGLSKIKS